jgi:hypothetical protein
MIFFGAFYAVIIVLATSVTYAVARSIVDMFNGNNNSTEQGAEHSAFEE